LSLSTAVPLILAERYLPEELYQAICTHLGEVRPSLPLPAYFSPVDYATRVADVLRNRGYTDDEIHAFFVTAIPPRPTLRGQVLVQHQASAPPEPRILKGIADIPLASVYVPPELQLLTRSPRHPHEDCEHAAPAEQAIEAGTVIQRWSASTGDESLLLIGEMGSGKTEYMLLMFREALRRARESIEHPIPIWLPGAHLAGELSEEFVLGQIKLSHDELRRCQRDGTIRFRLFLDGIDEATARHRRALALFRSTLGPCFRGVAATLRPGYFLDLPAATHVRVFPWRDQQIEEFLRRWAGSVDRAAIDRLRRSPYFTRLRPSLANPLFASFCAYVAAFRPEALRNRTELFQAVLDYVLQQWREVDTRDAKLSTMRSVPEILEFLQPLALEIVRGRRSTVTGEELHRAVFRRDESFLAVSDLIRGRYGLLTETDGGYIFTIRGLAEYLAGRALLAQGSEAIVAAAREPWALQPLRHTIVTAHRDPQHSLELLRRLLHHEATDDIATCNGQLQPVLVATLAASDLADDVPDSLIDPIVAAVLRRIAEETTSWVGPTTLEALPEMLPMAHALAQRLRDRLLALLALPANRAAWYAAHDVGCVHQHIARLTERDPQVRAVICRHLTRFIDHPDAQWALNWELHDDQDSRRTRPCLEAGLALRHATRGPAFDPWRARLADLVTRGGQLASFSAALALRPGEAPAEALVEGYKRGNTAGYRFDGVLAELAMTTDGRAALDTHWPSWASPTEQPHWGWPESTADEHVAALPAPPPSASTRARIISCLMSGAAALTPEQQRTFLALPEVLHELSHTAQRLPEDAVATILPRLLLAVPCSRGRAAIQELGRRSRVAAAILRDRLKALIDTLDRTTRRGARRAALHGELRRWAARRALAPQTSWSRTHATCELRRRAVRCSNPKRLAALRHHVRMRIQFFPGRGFDALVREHDRVAIAVFARWLRECHADHFREYDDTIPPDILAINAIQQIARRILSRRKEAHTLLPWSPRNLNRFSSLWQTDDEVWSALTKILCAWGYNLEVFATATRNSRLPEPVQSRLATVLEAFLERHGNFNTERDEYTYWHNAATVLVRYVRDLGYPPALLPFLERLAGRRADPICGGAALDATIALVPFLDTEELARLSQQRARYFVNHPATLSSFSPAETRALLEADAGAWMSAFRAVVLKLPRDSRVHRPLRDLVGLLPASHQQAAAAAWHEAVSHLEFPWFETEFPSSYTRPADEARRVEYEAGMALATAEELRHAALQRVAHSASRTRP
jgi:hypothetical protein